MSSLVCRSRRRAASWSRTPRWGSIGRQTIGARWTPPAPIPTSTRWEERKLVQKRYLRFCVLYRKNKLFIMTSFFYVWNTTLLFSVWSVYCRASKSLIMIYNKRAHSAPPFTIETNFLLTKENEGAVFPLSLFVPLFWLTFGCFFLFLSIFLLAFYFPLIFLVLLRPFAHLPMEETAHIGRAEWVFVEKMDKRSFPVLWIRNYGIYFRSGFSDSLERACLHLIKYLRNWQFSDLRRRTGTNVQELMTLFSK